MTPADEAEWIAEAVRRSYRDAEVPWPPRAAGPAPLNQIISTYNLAHEEVPGLNHAAASACLRRWGVHWEDIPEPDPALAGFLYANAVGGFLFVRRGDIVTRRRLHGGPRAGPLSPASGAGAGPPGNRRCGDGRGRLRRVGDGRGLADRHGAAGQSLRRRVAHARRTSAGNSPIATRASTGRSRGSSSTRSRATCSSAARRSPGGSSRFA